MKRNIIEILCCFCTTRGHWNSSIVTFVTRRRVVEWSWISWHGLLSFDSSLQATSPCHFCRSTSAPLMHPFPMCSGLIFPTLSRSSNRIHPTIPPCSLLLSGAMAGYGEDPGLSRQGPRLTAAVKFVKTIQWFSVVCLLGRIYSELEGEVVLPTILACLHRLPSWGKYLMSRWLFLQQQGRNARTKVFSLQC